MRGYLLVRTDGLLCGLPVHAVRHVLDVEKIDAAPSGHVAFLGVLPVRDRFVPFVHLRALLDRRTARPDPPPTAVVVECGGALVALGVDDAEVVVRERPEARPTGWALPWASGVARRGEHLIPVVDLAVVAERLETTTVSEVG